VTGYGYSYREFGSKTGLDQTLNPYPKQYQHHAQIFSEDGAQHFPLSQSTDMVVCLKPGMLDMLNCKVYPLS
jgi:hypothetical protein